MKTQQTGEEKKDNTSIHLMSVLFQSALDEGDVGM